MENTQETKDADPINAIPEPPEEFVDYEFSGVTLQFPSNATPEQIQGAIKGFMSTPEFDRIVDKDTGAPAYVRGIVGSVYKPEDKLSTLQKYYPDAMPYGENFVFTNPSTGRPTLYNPKGLDIGDVASVAREATVTVGSGLGATIGAGGALVAGQAGPQIAAPEELLTVPLAASAGSGLGAGIAGSAYDALLSVFGLKVDTRSSLQVASDTTIEVAGSALGEGIGRQVGPLLKKQLGGATKEAQKIAAQFKSLGIEPSASVVTGGRRLGRVEAAVAQTAAGGNIIDEQAGRIVEQTSKAVDDIVRQIGEPKTAQGAGEAIRQAAVKASERFGFKQEKIYTQAFDLIGRDTLVEVSAIKALKTEMLVELKRAPKSMAPSINKAISMLDNILADASAAVKTESTGILDQSGNAITREVSRKGAGIEFSALRKIRTNIGRDLADPLLSGSTGSQNEAMKRVYAALTLDMSNAAAATSDEAAKKLAVADRYTRIWSNTTQTMINKIGKFDADEKAYKFALAASRDGGTSLSRLRGVFTPEEWDTVAATVLDRLGQANPGVQNAAGDTFSINSFVTNWNKLAPEAKQALFGGKRYASQRQALDSLVDLMAKMKDVKRFSNTSNTAGTLHTLIAFNALGGAVGAMSTGDIEGGALGITTTVAGSILAPRAAAKLLTNPNFVNWLAQPVEQGIRSVPAHMARLVAIGKANPEIKEEVDQFIKQMQLNTKPQDQPVNKNNQQSE